MYFVDKEEFHSREAELQFLVSYYKKINLARLSSTYLESSINETLRATCIHARLNRLINNTSLDLKVPPIVVIEVASQIVLVYLGCDNYDRW